MLIELIREKPTNSGAVRSKVRIDGDFFGYGLENSAYMFPNGIYTLYGRTSPKFGRNKVYINVPGRSNIMFHGGNTADQTTGCVLIAANRDGETISGDLSDELFKVVDAAANRGEGVALEARNDNTKLIFALGVIGAIGVYLLNKKR